MALWRSIRNAPKRVVNLSLNSKLLDVDGRSVVLHTASLAPVPAQLP